jgi:hypothetical protein
MRRRGSAGAPPAAAQLRPGGRNALQLLPEQQIDPQRKPAAQQPPQPRSKPLIPSPSQQQQQQQQRKNQAGVVAEEDDEEEQEVDAGRRPVMQRAGQEAGEASGVSETIETRRCRSDARCKCKGGRCTAE